MGPEVLLLLALALATAPPAPLPPQSSDGKFSSVFTFHFENDSLPGGGSDNSYTQGLELRVGMNRATPWKRLPLNWAWHLGDDDDALSGANVSIGQTIFTPHNLITYSPRADDRPFGAFLYVGAESIRVRESHGFPSPGKVLKPRRLVFGVAAGMIGPVAGGRETQSAFHVLRENRMAKGWLVSQSPNRPQINFRLTNEHIVLSTAERFNKTSWGSFFDLTMMEEGVLGTTQTYAGIGATVRLGRGLSGLPGVTMPFRAAPSSKKAFEISARVGGRVRGMLHNAFVSGPLGASNGRETEHGLNEWHVGGEVRVHEWRVSYLVITQGREIKNQAAELPETHRFVALNISREGPAWGPEKVKFRQIASGTRFNLRLGRARTSINPDGPVNPKPSLAGSWGVEHALPLGFAVAYEKTGATREGGPPVGGVHTDQFLLARAVTLGWETPSTTSRHKLQVRAGGGLARARYQVTPDTGSLFEPEPETITETGKSALVGVRYSIRLGAPVSLTLDAARSRLYVNKAIVTRADITSFTVGVQIHPWRRDTGDKQ